MSRFFIGMFVGAVLVFGTQRYHVVRTNEGVYLIPKLAATFEEPYVDIREFGVGDWAHHMSLAEAMVRAKKDHLLKDSATESFRQGLQEAVEKLTSSAAAAPKN